MITKEDLASKWVLCKQAERYGLEFGKACYEWKLKLDLSDTSFVLADVLKELEIPEEAGYRWLSVYMASESIKLLKFEKRRNRGEPPDSFEDLRKLVKRMLNIGFVQLKTDPKIDPSHLDSAKTWAQIVLDKKIAA